MDDRYTAQTLSPPSSRCMETTTHLQARRGLDLPLAGAAVPHWKNDHHYQGKKSKACERQKGKQTTKGVRGKTKIQNRKGSFLALTKRRNGLKTIVRHCMSCPFMLLPTPALWKNNGRAQPDQRSGRGINAKRKAKILSRFQNETIFDLAQSHWQHCIIQSTRPQKPYH